MNRVMALAHTPFLNLAMWIGFFVFGFLYLKQFVDPYKLHLFILFVIAASLWAVAELHENGKIKPNEEGKLFNHIPKTISEKIMVTLDHFTNTAELQEIKATYQSTESLDTVAISAAVNSEVIGQKAVVDEITTVLYRRLHMVSRSQPIGVFCLAGPKGTGKTELAKQFAKALGRKPLFFDMTQCSEPHNASTLFGSPQGYAGGAGSLTSGLESYPNAVVIFDEFEKAHPDVMRRLLAFCNEGSVMDAHTGKSVPTNKCIVFITTNAGADEFSELMKQVADRDQITKASKAILTRAGKFPPEVVSRFDKVFVVDKISEDDMGLLGAILIRRIVETNYGLKLAPGGISAGMIYNIIKRSAVLQDAGGVRDVVREIENSIADGLIEAKTRHNARSVRITVDKDHPTFQGYDKLEPEHVRVEIAA